MDATGKDSIVKSALRKLMRSALRLAGVSLAVCLGSGGITTSLAQDIDLLSPQNEKKEEANLIVQVPALKTLAPPEILPALDRLAQVAPADRQLKVSLSKATAELVVAGEVALRCSIAQGVSQHPTARGEFTITGLEKNFMMADHGVFKDKDGRVVLRSVFASLDLLPHGCVFEATPVRYFFRTSEGGPCVIGGQVTGTSLTNGCLMVPEKIAALLHERLTYPLTLIVE